MKKPQVSQQPAQAPAASSTESAEAQPTRTRVATIILERGPQTATALAEALGLTPAAIRRHLEGMLADGTVEAREQRRLGPRGRGRPAKVFHLTDAGRDAFYQAYDHLAVSALRYIRDTAGDQAVAEFARMMVSRLEDRYQEVAATFPDGPGTTALAEALSEDGYAASVEPARLGEQLCQHHCPVAHVAEQFPQLCEAETAVFSRILGRPVQRLATIAHGDGVCTTHVPSPDAPAVLHRHLAHSSTGVLGTSVGKDDRETGSTTGNAGRRPGDPAKTHAKTTATQTHPTGRNTS